MLYEIIFSGHDEVVLDRFLEWKEQILEIIHDGDTNISILANTMCSEEYVRQLVRQQINTSSSFRFYTKYCSPFIITHCKATTDNIGQAYLKIWGSTVSDGDNTTAELKKYSNIVKFLKKYNIQENNKYNLLLHMEVYNNIKQTLPDYPDDTQDYSEEQPKSYHELYGNTSTVSNSNPFNLTATSFNDKVSGNTTNLKSNKVSQPDVFHILEVISKLSEECNEMEAELVRVTEQLTDRISAIQDELFELHQSIQEQQ